MRTALRTSAVTLSVVIASIGLTGFTTLPAPNAGKIDWQYGRSSTVPENGSASPLVGLSYSYDTAVGSVGLPTEAPGVFTLKGARGANSTTVGSMPGLNALLTSTHSAVTAKATGSGTYTATEKAADLAALSAVVPNTFAASVAKALPEGKNIQDNPTFKPASDANSNLIMKAGGSSKVWASFVLEGAGFKNSVGYFIYDPLCAPKHRNQVREFNGSTSINTVAIAPPTAATTDNTRTYTESRTCTPRSGTTAEIVILPNASQDSPLPRAGNTTLGTSSTGPTAYLGEIPEGLAMGFVVIANAWNATGNATGQPGANKNQSTNWIYYSLSDLNPEPTGTQTVGTRSYDDLKKHVILLKDGNLESFTTGYHRLALGFEDYDRKSTSCDHDFNDLVMVLHVEKKESVSNIKVAADTNNDSTEVVKSLADTSSATYSYYPSASTWATLAYEDLWPNAPSDFFLTPITQGQADYDFNDLVVKYRSKQTILNDKITQLDLTYRLDARGGKIKSGFAVQLRGVKPDQVSSIQVIDPNGVTTNVALSGYSLNAPALHAYLGNATNVANADLLAKAVDAGTNQLTVRLFNNAYDWLPAFLLPTPKYSGTQANCNEFYNTYRVCPVEASKTFTVQIKLTGTGIPKTQLVPPYNPYIFSTDSPSKEVHLPNQSPTQLGKTSNSFGTAQDATNKTTWSKTYVTADGRPWALHIPYEWDHPQESNRIGDVFGGFKPWVESLGVSSTTWYTAPVVGNTFRGTRKFPQ
jgi:LruC domain-containing protein